jgi:putative oxidoreductase
MLARVKDTALLLGRIGVGVVFLNHGLQKWDSGVDKTAGFFGSVGIPLPTAAAVFAIAIEILGAIAFILGFALPLIAAGFLIDSVGAILSTETGHIFTGQGNFELLLVLALAGLAFGLNGGRYSLDHLLFWSKRESRELQTV